MKALHVAALALLAPGCAGQISGTIDDNGIPAFGDGGFIHLDFQNLFVDVYQVTVMIMTYGDACNVATKVEEEHREAQQDYQRAVQNAADQAAIDDALDEYAATLDATDRKYLPPDYWTTTFQINDDDEDDIEGGKFDFDQGNVLPEAAMTICHQTDYPDYGDIVRGQKDDNKDCWVAEDGSVEVDSYVADETIQAHGDADLVEADDRDDNVGDVQISFGVRHCEEYEDLVD